MFSNSTGPFTRSNVRSNPLAGIEVVGIRDGANHHRRPHDRAVIPWRGLRSLGCWQQMVIAEHRRRAVIPWRGLRSLG